MAVKPLWTSPPQFVDANGDPYSGAFLFFYAAGSSTKQNTFTDDTGNTACPNPITLNSSGYPAVSGTILAPWGTVGETYKIGLAAPGASDPPASFIWTVDDVAPINDTTVTIDQWVNGPAPTYIGATQFSLVGDQTSTFQVGRRVKTTNSGGTIYSTITVSAYTSLTTITVVNDSGTLDAGLSAVSYGLLSPTNPSTPLLADTYPIVSGSADKTKKLRFEVDGLTTATTRVITPPDVDVTLPYMPGTFGAMRVHTANGTWTKPAGLKRVRVRVRGGGGGGGGGVSGGNPGGGGGGQGGYSEKVIEAASLGATEAVTVGAAANGGSAGNSGTTGNTSSFGAHCSAAGGTEGNTSGVGGTGGNATGGNINTRGAPGQSASLDVGSTQHGASGGGDGGGVSAAAGAANTGGGGGGGTGNGAGAAGGSGIVIVEEFY